MTLQPYQKAGEEINRQNRAPGEFLKGAASTLVGTAVGGSIINKILPFLNKFIPQEMAIKGLSKIDKRLGKFIKSSFDQGYDNENVMEFIKEKISPEEEKRKQTLKGFNQKVKKPSLQEQEMQRFQGQYGQQGQDQSKAALQVQQQPQGSQSRDQLLAAMQQLTQALRG